jgi:lipopolysaccharide/colanic/teichoic acid biosynthesis glycosyltransferase
MTQLHDHMAVRLRTSRGYAGKRLLDIAGALGLAAVFSPVIVLVPVLVALEDGLPVTFSHARVGRDGRLFKAFKFRSMVRDSQAVLAQLLATDPAAKAEWEADQKLKNDPRVTRIGRFLRATSLDELPQIINVLKGEMSLVGPRPVVQDELARYGDAAKIYLSLKPGLTGLWQVSGRNNVSYDQRVALDCEYAARQSLLLDISILARTVKVVLWRDGSY